MLLPRTLLATAATLPLLLLALLMESAFGADRESSLWRRVRHVLMPRLAPSGNGMFAEETNNDIVDDDDSGFLYPDIYEAMLNRWSRRHQLPAYSPECPASRRSAGDAEYWEEVFARPWRGSGDEGLCTFRAELRRHALTAVPLFIQYLARIPGSGLAATQVARLGRMAEAAREVYAESQFGLMATRACRLAQQEMELYKPGANSRPSESRRLRNKKDRLQWQSVDYHLLVLLAADDRNMHAFLHVPARVPLRSCQITNALAMHECDMSPTTTGSGASVSRYLAITAQIRVLIEEATDALKTWPTGISVSVDTREPGGLLRSIADSDDEWVRGLREFEIRAFGALLRTFALSYDKQRPPLHEYAQHLWTPYDLYGIFWRHCHKQVLSVLCNPKFHGNFRYQ